MQTTVRFTDYAPMVFRRLREIFKIEKTVYIHSIGPEQVISNLLLGEIPCMQCRYLLDICLIRDFFKPSDRPSFPLCMYERGYP